MGAFHNTRSCFNVVVVVEPFEDNVKMERCDDWSVKNKGWFFLTDNVITGNTPIIVLKYVARNKTDFSNHQSPNHRWTVIIISHTSELGPVQDHQR